MFKKIKAKTIAVIMAFAIVFAGVPALTIAEPCNTVSQAEAAQAKTTRKNSSRKKSSKKKSSKKKSAKKKSSKKKSSKKKSAKKKSSKKKSSMKKKSTSKKSSKKSAKKTSSRIKSAKKTTQKKSAKKKATAKNTTTTQTTSRNSAQKKNTQNNSSSRKGASGEAKTFQNNTSDVKPADNIKSKTVPKSTSKKTTKAKKTSKKKYTEVRGLWVSVYDYPSLGLKTDSKATFKKNADKLLKKMQSYKLNTLYMQVRAYDDAAWKSKTFHAMKYISPKATKLGYKNASKKAASTLKFDPMQVMIKEAHAKKIKIVAWMNPYRCSTGSNDYYLDPANGKSQSRVVNAVKEVMTYNVDGIVFDDYFYTAVLGYKNTSGIITRSAFSADHWLKASKKRQNVNNLIKKVYKAVKASNKKATFGIAPQGNLENDRALGADIDTWLSKNGYIDYLMPQIYWSNNWGSSHTKMFSNRLKQFRKSSLNKNGRMKYVALALYRSGEKPNQSSKWTDYGWSKSKSNIASQYKELKKAGCEGFSLFSAQFLNKSAGKAEMKNLKKVLSK
ncbi:MAG: hypothetical protein DUD27_05685 [Lachnospiraceae bacterium]|uniref:Family 10 glycosylhydrolase n=1 Tax=Candidatus Weimeria bifida TaxID=2599074 RepID=A0A6N7J155_9FIRM|nr:family 10 glycosylhydrolase [Candidatus Weimeria bifida]RRF96156.1 MAG: hypothetical protein DUD27_05685 [Lachnospiraceae bacterium]